MPRVFCCSCSACVIAYASFFNVGIELYRSSTDRKYNNLKLIEIGSAILLIWPYKVLPVTTKNFMHQSYFSSFIFIVHFFRGPAGAHVNCGSFFQIFFLYIHFLSNNSLISSWIPAKFVSIYALPVILFSV